MPDRSYVSDHTRFMRQFMEQHPEQAEKQRKARLTWWDKRETPAEREALEQARVRQGAYVYYGNP